jgi:chaperonin GroES
MRIQPLADHVLIEPLKNEEKTKSGILLPETAEKEKPEQGKVVAVGPGKKTDEGKLIPIEVKVGDVVLFTKYGPNEVKIEVDGQEKEYLIAKEEDILAVLE